MNLTGFSLPKILHILAHGQNIAASFLAAADDLLLTLTGEDQEKLKDALTDARARSDALHKEVAKRRPSDTPLGDAKNDKED